MSTLRIVLAGSTHHTRLIAEALLAAQFQILGCITPQPKLVGRKQVLTYNPVHEWANEQQIPTILIDKKIDRVLEDQMHSKFGQPDLSQPFCDILLVVDFGYYVPGWLLQKAGVAPLNIHPSKLPRWRGSSPGQFAVLYGDNPSAVSIITVAKAMDQGDIWHQKEFVVAPDWDSAAYYQQAFMLIAQDLPEILKKIMQGSCRALPQPLESPTEIARKITKPDCFIPWQVLRYAQTNDLTLHAEAIAKLAEYLATNREDSNPPLLAHLLLGQPKELWAKWLDQATRAFSPWPKIWSIVPTIKGEQRLLIHQTKLIQTSIELITVQLEGQKPARYKQILTSLA